MGFFIFFIFLTFLVWDPSHWVIVIMWKMVLGSPGLISVAPFSIFFLLPSYFLLFDMRVNPLRLSVLASLLRSLIISARMMAYACFLGRFKSFLLTKI